MATSNALFQHVLVAIDPTDGLAVKVLRAAKDAATAHGAELSVISIVNPAPTPRPAPGPASFAAYESAMQSAEDFESTKRMLAELVRREAPNAQLEALRGATAATILKHAEGVGADLIVMGTHQKGFWEKLAVGSLSMEVANRTKAAIMLLPPSFAE
jgi:nucleotide-binding universal stress UspA family protein